MNIKKILMLASIFLINASINADQKNKKDNTQQTTNNSQTKKASPQNVNKTSSPASHKAESKSNTDSKKPMNSELINNFSKAVQDVFSDSKKDKAKTEQAIDAFKKIRTARKTSSITKEQSEEIKKYAKKLFGSMTKSEAMKYNIE